MLYLDVYHLFTPQTSLLSANMELAKKRLQMGTAAAVNRLRCMGTLSPPNFIGFAQIVD